MRAGHAVLGGVVGTLFVGHGLQKFGKLGGHGLEGTGQFFESLGLKPGKTHATAAALSETGGGALLATGIATPVAAAALHGTMSTAIWTVHKEKGLWNTDGGYEFNLTLMAAVFAVSAEREGLAWALASLAAGVAGSAAILTFARDTGEAGGEAVEEQPAGDPASPNGQADAETLNATA